MYCGIDVSGKSLAVAIQRVHQRVEQRSFPNTSVGHKALIVWLGKAKSPVRVSLEAAGIYSLDLAFALSGLKYEEQSCFQGSRYPDPSSFRSARISALIHL